MLQANKLIYEPTADQGVHGEYKSAKSIQQTRESMVDAKKYSLATHCRPKFVMRASMHAVVDFVLHLDPRRKGMIPIPYLSLENLL
jgi:hypothetical protein